MSAGSVSGASAVAPWKRWRPALSIPQPEAAQPASEAPAAVPAATETETADATACPIMVPATFELKLTNRINRNGSLGATLYMFAPKADKQVGLRFVVAEAGQSFPVGTQLQALQFRLQDGLPVAIAFGDFEDGIAAFATLMRARVVACA